MIFTRDAKNEALDFFTRADEKTLRNTIDNMWGEKWDGSACNAYAGITVLGATIKQVKQAIVSLAKNGNSSVLRILAEDSLSLHEGSKDGYVYMAYHKGAPSFAYVLSSALPGAVVTGESGGWYGSNYALIAKDGRDAVPGKDYDGKLEYSELWEELEDDEEAQYDADLEITDKAGNMTILGGGALGSNDLEVYRSLASSAKEVSSYALEEK